MAWRKVTKIEIENLERGSKKKRNVAELWFMCCALVHIVVYQCMKFEVNRFYSLEVMAWTKNESEN